MVTGASVEATALSGKEMPGFPGRDGGPQAIEFYKKAFGATEIHRMPDPRGLIMHAALKVGDSMFFLNDEMPMPDGGKSPTSIGGTAVTINLYVPDADKIYKQAISAGA